MFGSNLTLSLSMGEVDHASARSPHLARSSYSNLTLSLSKGEVEAAQIHPIDLTLDLSSL